ncbi:MAG TPA: serine hydrolase domain-containing protein, partial [Candidatus Limnocylindria bacterium]|nr:serine hydrolase domain-containing protein [Candidatus Limnocylindria bacterium]
DYFEGRPKGGRSLADQLISEGDRAFGVEEVVEIVRDQLTPHFPPQPADADRQRSHYSDTNFQLLGAVIEAVTGLALGGAFEQLLFQPLGLKHTYLYDYASGSVDEPVGFMLGDQAFSLALTMRSIGPEGGLVATAGDMLAFLRALTRGEPFDEPSTSVLMSQRWNRLHFSLDPRELRVPRWPIQYGLGMMRFRIPRPFTGRWSMPPVIGHSGSTGSWLFDCPQMDVLLAGTVD